MSTRTRTPDAITMPDVVARVSPIGDTPTLEGLAWALRHPETWPEGFEWDYRACTSCAMGLAVRLWRDIGIPTTSDVGDALHISSVIATRFFIGMKRDIGATFMSDVKPHHVADAIDRYLATRA